MANLTRYDHARAALQAAHSIDEVKDIRDRAEAMAAYARQAKDTELLLWATEIQVRAGRRAGEMLRESAARGDRASLAGGRPKKKASDDTTLCIPTLTDFDISRDESSRWQKLAAMSEEHFEAAVVTAREVAGEVTTAFMLRQVTGTTTHTHRTKYTGENEWHTPPEYLAKVREVLGAIDLDAASSPVAQGTVQATRYYSLDDNALTQDWPGRVWLNPPYAQPLIAQFVDKLLHELATGRTAQAILLTHNSTDTAWFQKATATAQAICFTKGRIRFVSAFGEIAAPTQGQAFFYFGPHAPRFATVFASVGCVMVAYAWRHTVKVPHTSPATSSLWASCTAGVAYPADIVTAGGGGPERPYCA